MQSTAPEACHSCNCIDNSQLPRENHEAGIRCSSR